MDALEVLKKRRSVRSYLPDPVPREIIEDIIDCGRLAATARNLQPWKFVVITDIAKRDYIGSMADYGKHILQAPVCIAVFCEDIKYLIEDGSAATQNILLAAKAHGLGSCWIAGHKKPYAQAIAKYLNAPEQYKLISLITIGYAQRESNAPKKSLEEVLCWEQF